MVLILTAFAGFGGWIWALFKDSRNFEQAVGVQWCCASLEYFYANVVSKIPGIWCAVCFLRSPGF